MIIYNEDKDTGSLREDLVTVLINITYPAETRKRRDLKQ